MSPHVLLLRAPTVPPELDRYEVALTRASFQPLSLPVLETALENLDTLARIIRSEEDKIAGVVVTSARAVDACAQTGVDIDWSAVRFYAVGPATAAQLAQLPHPPRDVRGTESGTAEKLAQFIVQDTAKGDRLLYLTGDKNRDVLARVVRESLGEDALRELRVYGTRGVRDFEGSLARALGGEEGGGEPWWIVYFAPSAAAHVTPALRTRFALSERDAVAPLQARSRIRRARIAAIGPTTADYLRDELGLRVDAVPDAPNADSLVAALQAAQ
ncbi:tetrapyrrole biosynthesis, uroporphyrinogen III synthase [Gloeopeniophorella convolvens]|nr:tetrapyrrole biosynthesis, uroporphyrinogen III synthase [Gloeopeniophorella convolvens]